MACAGCVSPDQSCLGFAGGARWLLRARLSVRATRAWGPGSKDPTAQWISEGLWLTWGPDEQSFDDSKAPCGGRPRSVWNPPHGPSRPQRPFSTSSALRSQARASLALATGGFGAEVQK